MSVALGTGKLVEPHALPFTHASSACNILVYMLFLKTSVNVKIILRSNKNV